MYDFNRYVSKFCEWLVDKRADRRVLDLQCEKLWLRWEWKIDG